MEVCRGLLGGQVERLASRMLLLQSWAVRMDPVRDIAARSACCYRVSAGFRGGGRFGRSGEAFSFDFPHVRSGW